MWAWQHQSHTNDGQWLVMQQVSCIMTAGPEGKTVGLYHGTGFCHPLPGEATGRRLPCNGADRVLIMVLRGGAEKNRCRLRNPPAGSHSRPCSACPLLSHSAQCKSFCRPARSTPSKRKSCLPWAKGELEGGCDWRAASNDENVLREELSSNPRECDICFMTKID